MKILVVLLGVLSMVLSSAAFALPMPSVTATDPVASFTLGTGVITTGTGGPATDGVVLSAPPFPAGSTLHLELALSYASGFTVGSIFVGTPDASPDLYILDSNWMPLILADVNWIKVTGLASGPAGADTTSVTLGDLAGTGSDLTLTGGSLVNLFGGIGAKADLSVLLNDPTDAFGFFSTFDTNWTSQMNVQLQFQVPEPGTFTLVALPLVGLAMCRRVRRKG